MPEASAEPPVLVLVRDLIFATRIRAAAEDLGITVKIVRDPRQLIAEPGSRLIVDLNLPGAITAASAWKQAHHRPVIGFVSHVDTVTIQEARGAGVDRVLARSQFVQTLADLLR